MTAEVDIVNRALQAFGARTTVTAAQLAALSSNEAKQADLVLVPYRDQLLRMAPWDCGLKVANLTYITSTPGTPENTSAATSLWEPGQPPPPWAYEYQYPVDCLRACWIIPAAQTSGDGIPITTAITGGIPSTWNGPPVRFKVQTDEFYPVTAAVVAAGGTGHAVGDEITLAEGATDDPPIGAPVKLLVATIGGGGAVATVTVVDQIANSETRSGGSYFAVQTNPVAQGSTTGAGTGATFNLTFGAKGTQRVILNNQQNAILAYVKRVTDPNVMDDLFQEAWAYILGASICRGLTGDLKRANNCIEWANMKIAEARKADANEGLSVNDVTPDWIRIRGFAGVGDVTGPFSQFDWGNYWPLY